MGQSAGKEGDGSREKPFVSFRQLTDLLKQLRAEGNNDPVGNFGQSMRYRVENIREALDEAGEWFLDRESGKLHLLTVAGEDPRQMQIHAPRLERIVDLEGLNDDVVANVSFEKIDFQYTSYKIGLYDITPITSNSLRNGIQELRLFNRSVLPEEAKKTTASFNWKAPKVKLTLNEKKVIREVGPEKKYENNFIFTKGL